VKETYDNTANPHGYKIGDAVWLSDPVCKPNECYKLRKKIRCAFFIDHLTLTSAHLYNPKNNKVIKKSVHINHIKPCYQRDDTLKNREDIEDLPIVEVTYPENRQKLKTSFKNSQTNLSADADVRWAQTRRILKDDIQLLKAQRTRILRYDAIKGSEGGEPATIHPPPVDDEYYDAIKILRQRTKNGQTEYFMKWADAKAANSWTHASNVTEALTKISIVPTPR